MNSLEEERYQADIESLHLALQNTCAGFENATVLHAFALLLIDCSHQEFFEEELSRDERINSVFAVLRSLIAAMHGRPT